VNAVGYRWTSAVVCVASTLLAGSAFPDELSPLATTGPKPEPVTPPSFEEIERAVTRGVNFLLSDQNENGSWGSPTLTKRLNIYAPVPGAHHAFRAAVTSLAISALIEADDRRPEVQRALQRGERWLSEHLPHVRRATGDTLYNVWAHAYSIQALVRLHDRAKHDDAHQQQIIELIAQQIEILERYAFIGGGWDYYPLTTKRPSGSSSCFTTATALIALDEARELGLDVSAKVIDKAVGAIKRQRKPDFSYAYGEYVKMYPMLPINRPAGSLGRSQVCNYALRIMGDELVTDEVIRTWLNRLIARNGWLSVGRKRPIPHESFFQVAGYFYYYGHFYAAYCVGILPAAEQRYYKNHLAHILLQLQEKDGSWWVQSNIHCSLTKMAIRAASSRRHRFCTQVHGAGRMSDRTSRMIRRWRRNQRAMDPFDEQSEVGVNA
jgi:hypothetical protein